MEPILTPNPYVYTLFPIRYPRIWDLYKRLESQLWTAEDIDFSKDPADFQTLNEGERTFLLMILAFFAASDGLVMENVSSNFAREVQLSEARAFYAYQMFNESIHNEVYSLMIDTLVRDPAEKLRLFHAISEVPGVKRLADWAKRYMDSNAQPFRVRIVAFVIYEALVFSSKFAGIAWFKKRNKMPGVVQSNLLIMPDEGAHEEMGVEVYNLLEERCDAKLVQDMVREVVDIDLDSFMVGALSSDLIGLNRTIMEEYVHLVANRVLTKLGCESIYNVPNASTNPIMTLMDSLGMENKVSFFESRSHVYMKAGVVSRPEGRDFSTNADF